MPELYASSTCLPGPDTQLDRPQKSPVFRGMLAGDSRRAKYRLVSRAWYPATQATEIADETRCFKRESGLSVGHRLDGSRSADRGAGTDRAAPTRPGECEVPPAQEPRAWANLRATQGNPLPRESSGTPQPGTIAPHVIGEAGGMRR